MAFKLEPESSFRTEIARVVREQVEGAVECVGRRNVVAKDRVHQARTACKKARAALKLVRSVEPKVCRRGNARLGAAGRMLSPLRDADATLDTLAALARHAVHAPVKRSLAPVQRALRAEKAAADSAAERERRLAAFARTLRAEAKRLAKWEPDAGVHAVAENLAASYKRARRAMRLARKHPSAEAFHEWRKAVKVYTHQCALLRAAWPAPMKALRGELKELGRRLGEEHDLSVLFERLVRLPSRGVAGIDEETLRVALALIEARQEELRREAFDYGERLFTERPKDVAVRLVAWWRVAQRAHRAKAA